MRPPDLPGGNSGYLRHEVAITGVRRDASMRPPDLPGGNKSLHGGMRITPSVFTCFNEAAGFTRRKPPALRTPAVRLAACTTLLQ